MLMQNIKLPHLLRAMLLGDQQGQMDLIMVQDNLCPIAGLSFRVLQYTTGNMRAIGNQGQISTQGEVDKVHIYNHTPVYRLEHLDDLLTNPKPYLTSAI